MWLYICIGLLMGIIHKRNIHAYWSREHIFSTPIFGRLMRRDRFKQLRKMIHFTDPLIENPGDELKKLRLFLEYLQSKFEETYTREEHLAIDKYISLWKGRLKFRIYITSNRERYGVKIFMLCESNTVYLLNYIVYVGASTAYRNAPANLQLPFEDYASPSKFILSLFHRYLNKGYCVTSDNYYRSPELGKALI